MVQLAVDSVPTVAAYDISPRTAAVTRQQTNLRRGSVTTRHLTVIVFVGYCFVFLPVTAANRRTRERRFAPRTMETVAASRRAKVNRVFRFTGQLSLITYKFLTQPCTCFAAATESTPRGHPGVGMAFARVVQRYDSRGRLSRGGRWVRHGDCCCFGCC